MDIQSAVRAYILADPAIAAAIGDRLWPIKLPQNATLPAITMKGISDVRFPTLRGRAGLARPRLQLDVWIREMPGTAVALECRRIGGLLLDRLEGKNVELDDDSESPAVPRRVAFEYIDAEDTYEPDTNGGFFRHRADYYVGYQTGN